MKYHNFGALHNSVFSHLCKMLCLAVIILKTKNSVIFRFGGGFGMYKLIDLTVNALLCIAGKRIATPACALVRNDRYIR